MKRTPSFGKGIHGRCLDPRASGAAHDIGKLLVRYDHKDIWPSDTPVSGQNMASEAKEQPCQYSDSEEETYARKFMWTSNALCVHDVVFTRISGLQLVR